MIFYEENFVSKQSISIFIPLLGSRSMTEPHLLSALWSAVSHEAQLPPLQGGNIVDCGISEGNFYVLIVLIKGNKLGFFIFFHHLDK